MGKAYLQRNALALDLPSHFKFTLDGKKVIAKQFGAAGHNA